MFCGDREDIFKAQFMKAMQQRFILVAVYFVNGQGHGFAQALQHDG